MDTYLDEAHYSKKIPYYLRDQFKDFSSIVNPIDKSTGKARFSVPLIKMQLPLINLNFDLMFDGNNDKSNVFGKGWSLLQDNNFILFQHSSSFFKDDNRYYIFYENGRKQLEFVEEKNVGNDNVRIYELLNEQSANEIRNQELIACHHVNKNFWEVKRRDGIGIIKYYGEFNIDHSNTSETNTIWELRNHAGIKSKTPIIWHLREINSADSPSEKIVVKYKTLDKFEYDGKYYASELHLQRILSFNNYNDNHVLEFFYGDNNLITSYFYTTKQYYQAVYFEYENSTLIGIYEKDKQKNINNHLCTISDKPYCFEFMKFTYDKSFKNRINEIKLHTGVQIKLTYKNDDDIHTKLYMNRANMWSSLASKRNFLETKHQFIQGYDYYVISYFDLDEDDLLIHHLHIVDLDFPLTGKIKDTDFYEKMSLPNYSFEVRAEIHHIAKSVVLIFKKNLKVLSVVIYDRKDVSLPWKQVLFEELDNVNSLMVGSDFLIVKNQVIWKTENTQQWKITDIFPENKTKNNNDYESFVGIRDRKFILFYTTKSDTIKFLIGYRDRRDTWNFKDLKGIDTKKIKENILENRSILEKGFKRYVKEDENEILKFREFYRSFAIQFYENIIVISYVEPFKRLKVVNTMIKVYTINDEFHIIEKMHGYRVLNGLEYHLLTTNKIRNLYVSLTPPGIITCGTTKITFGKNFEIRVETIKKDTGKDGYYGLLLGDEYVLLQDNATYKYKLIRASDNKELHNLDITYLGGSSIQYPVYIAYVKNSELHIIRFKKNRDIFVEKIEDVIMDRKFINPTSNLRTLIIEQYDFNKENFFFITLYNDETLPSDVIIRRDIILDSQKQLQRSTGYEYNFGTSIEIENKLYFTDVTLVPGNNKNEYGWIRDVQSEGKKYYDNKGTLIKTEKIKINSEDNENSQTNANQNNDDEVDDDEFYLYNIKENLKVVDFTPYKPGDEEVGYYGFENYEWNIIGRKTENHKVWKFNYRRILKDVFSLTGQNVLQLENNETMEGNFVPKNQNQKYIVSTWIYPDKVDEKIELGNILAYLTVSVGTSSDEIYTVLSECKQEMDGWFYLEAIIDLNIAQEIGKQKGITGNLQINIKIMSDDNSMIYVDHVRFLPLGNSFEAYVYDPISELVTEVIQANGLIKRQIYDKYEELIASTDEYGRIKGIHTCGKYDAKSLVKEELSSKTKIEVETGILQRFNKILLEENWLLYNYSNIEYHNNMLHTNELGCGISFKNNHIMFTESYGIRFIYAFHDSKGEFVLNSELKFQKQNNKTVLNYVDKYEAPVPDIAEVIFILEKKRFFIWVAGHLIFEFTTSKRGLNFTSLKNLAIKDMAIFINPSVKVIYTNKLGEKVQELQLISHDSVILTEYLYDELGRQAITTRPKILKQSNDKLNSFLLKYHPEWVTNANPNDINSVWRTNTLSGRINMKNAFTRIKFAKNPLDERYKILLPNMYGSMYSDDKQYVGRTNNKIITKLYPHEDGYNYQIQINQEIINDITVYDKNENKVAWLLDVNNCENCKGAISTYKYDDAGKLIEIMPPMWYDLNDALSRQNLTALPEHRAKIKFYRTSIYYNKAGKILLKKTQDTGLTRYLYDKNDLLRYVLYMGANIEKSTVLYFEYDQFARLINTGRVKNHTNTTVYECLINLDPKAKCEEIVKDDHKEEYQQFYYSDQEPEVILRGRLKRTITFNDATPLIEEIMYNGDKKTLSKRIMHESFINNQNITAFGEEQMQIKIPALQVKMRYSGDKLEEIEYPIKTNETTFKVIYQYGKHGKITKIGRPGSPEFFADIKYNADKLVNTESYIMGNGQHFSRKFQYNGFGYLQSMNDDFLNQTLYFTGEHKGDRNYTDGTITRTQFVANWHDKVKNEDKNKIRMSEDLFKNKKQKACFNELKNEGYFTNDGFQLKIFFPESYAKIPSVCESGIKGNTFASLLSKKGFPKFYGHSYEYGNYGELIEAKYFVGQKRVPPLDATTFMKIEKVDEMKANKIWDILKQNKFIGVRNYSLKDSRTHGREIRKDYFKVEEFNKIFNNMTITRDFKRWFLSVNSPTSLSILNKNLPSLFSNINSQISKTMSTLYKSLILDNQTHIALYNGLWNVILQQDHLFLLTKILHHHFSEDLGKAEFDLQFYDIDSNGNHRRFKRGFEEFKLTYKAQTNQIDKISFRNKSYDIKHDHRGNVIKAPHKQINKIKYHPVSNRPIEVYVEKGKKVFFEYDSNGERFSKRVKINGKLVKEIFYIRDERMRPLVESQISYSDDGKKDKLITAYIYGPRGLIGFIRRNKYYNVITDHAGSIRLVINDGKVVAAYDYLPYGTLMREFVSCADAQISYRYTGQEWDEELGLYNYHARFYDPTIGRFYQIDPKEQYFSPYKYAGNSPVSMVDPDGEFAFMILFAIIGAIAGAYIGGATANNNWNPIKWDWKSADTWLGIVGGGVGGALIAPGFAVSAAVIGTGATIAAGAGVAYISAAVANKNADFTKWDWSNPSTYNALFTGFGTGSGLVGSVTSVQKAFQGLSLLGKVGFIGGSVAYAGASIYIEGSKYEWDTSNPEMWQGFFGAITGAIDSPIAMGSGKLFSKMSNLKALGKIRKGNILKDMIKLLTNTVKNKSFLKNILKAGLITGAVVGAGASNDWDMTSVNTYFDMMQSVQSGIDAYKNVKNIAGHIKSLTKIPKALENISVKRVKKIIKIVYKDVKGIAKNTYKLQKTISSWFPEEKLIVVENSEFKIIIELDKLTTPILEETFVNNKYRNITDVRYTDPTYENKNKNAKEIIKELKNILEAVQYDSDKSNEFKLAFRKLIKKTISHPDGNEKIDLSFHITIKDLPNPKIYLHNYFEIETADPLWEYGLEQLYNQIQRRPRQKRSLTHSDFAVSNEFNDSSQNLSIRDAETNLYQNYINLARNNSSPVQKQVSYINVVTFNNFKTDEQSSSANNASSFISHVDAHVDMNSTLFLVDLFVRKITGARFVNSTSSELSSLDVQVQAMKIVDKFEKTLKKVAKKMKIPRNDLAFDPVDLQSKIYKKILSGKNSDVSRILKTSVKQSVPNKYVEEFLKYFCEYLKLKVSSEINCKK